MASSRRQPQPPPEALAPPQNLEAEELVLGACLYSRKAISDAADAVTAADFYRASHGRIFQAAIDLDGKGEPVDVVTLVDFLEQRGELEAAGGRVRLHELAALAPATANVAHHARIVKDMALLRGLLRTGGEITRLAIERPGETSELVEMAEQALLSLALERGHSEFVPLRDTVAPAYRQLMELHARGGELVGIASGFHDLDRITTGFRPGNLIVVAGRPAMGKTGFALGIIHHIAMSAHLPAALLTLEMSQLEITQRLMAMDARVDSQKVRTGRLDVLDWQRVSAAAGRLEGALVFLDDSPLTSMVDVRSKCRRLKIRCPGLALVVVDYLQLMTSGRSDESRVQEVSAISRGLKVLAREIETPIIAVSQLSRNVEQRHDKRPILSDLRESGSIEQDADLVLFLYRDEYYNPENEESHGIAEVNVAKQRNGPTGTVKLAFVKRFALFGDLAHDRQ